MKMSFNYKDPTLRYTYDKNMFELNKAFGVVDTTITHPDPMDPKCCGMGIIEEITDNTISLDVKFFQQPASLIPEEELLKEYSIRPRLVGEKDEQTDVFTPIKIITFDLIPNRNLWSNRPHSNTSQVVTEEAEK